MFYELEYAVTNRFGRDELTAVSKQLLNDGVTIGDLINAFKELISNMTDDAYSCLLSEMCDTFETNKI